MGGSTSSTTIKNINTTISTVISEACQSADFAFDQSEQISISCRDLIHNTGQKLKECIELAQSYKDWTKIEKDDYVRTVCLQTYNCVPCCQGEQISMESSVNITSIDKQTNKVSQTVSQNLKSKLRNTVKQDSGMDIGDSSESDITNIQTSVTEMLTDVTQQLSTKMSNIQEIDIGGGSTLKLVTLKNVQEIVLNMVQKNEILQKSVTTLASTIDQTTSQQTSSMITLFIIVYAVVTILVLIGIILGVMVYIKHKQK